MIGPNTIVFFIPFSVPLHEVKFTVDGLKNWLNQKKIKEVPYLCDSVTQQWMFWVHREKNLIFYSWNCQFWFWWSDGFLSSLLSPSLVKKTFWSSECLVFFLSPMSLFRQPPVFSVKVFWSDCASWQWGETNFTLISRPQRPRAQNKQDLQLKISKEILRF